ncbi:MAG: 1-deoxy-D-xylulose-5-phosphate reductoisomerase [Patescibacteria group bacterium]|nr:1-deoxy-D-xylulose-5-phosphate reductoisomerase [Patescibacteria group bacterium]
MKKIAILGSTGSVGTQALQIIKQHPSKFKIIGLTANTNTQAMLAQIKTFHPQAVAMMNKVSARELTRKIKTLDRRYSRIKIYTGLPGLVKIATLNTADIILTSVVGSIGIVPTFEAIKKSKTIALANKETLVAAGQIIMPAAKKYNAKIIPVDSEHSAIFQCLVGENPQNIKNLILTCSGGPFRKTPPSRLKKVTLKQALNHPSWKMGGKITIDSATLMNKGLEVIEAHWLFGLPYENIKVVVHPQSLVHSMVEFRDGSLKAQISQPSMSIPIQLAFSFPQRLKNKKIPRLDLSRKTSVNQLNQMTFEKPDFKKFPCLNLAYKAGRLGGTLPAALNAANETAVQYFLQGKIKYLDIANVIKKIIKKNKQVKNPNLSCILETDKKVKEQTRQLLDSLC